MSILVTQMNKPEAALAAAVHFLARRPPFDAFAFGVMTLSLNSQIRQRTYAFALEGQKVVGYLGWVLLDEARAEAFARENRTPRHDEAGGDDVVWLLVAAATSTLALKTMLAAAGRRYPGKRIMGVRHKPNGKMVVFDNTIRPKP